MEHSLCDTLKELKYSAINLHTPISTLVDICANTHYIVNII